MRAQSRTAFPVGLYGVCLFALCALTVPALGDPLARFLVGAASLPLRLWSALGAPAAAASPGAAAGVQDLQAQLRARLQAHALVVAPGLPPEVQGELCEVAAAVRPGGGALPNELRLPFRHQDVADCLPIVTFGEDLVGFLCRPGQGPALRDRATDPARVLLLNHPDSRRVAGAVAMADGPPLRMVVEPAAAVDPAPLRSSLWEDPYRAADPRHMQSDLEVRTVDLRQAPWSVAVPGGLRLGRTFVWGYQSVTIGVYIRPAFDPRTLSHVVLWRPPAAPPLPRPDRVALPAVLRPLPGGAGDQALLEAALATALPDGAAVVQDGICLGLLRSLAFGQGLMTSFASSRRRWSLLLLDDTESAPPVPLLGEVVAAKDRVAWVRCQGPLPTAGGWLFTGSNGPGCPPCLLLGRAEAEGGLLRVLLHDAEGPAAVAVLLPPGAVR